MASSVREDLERDMGCLDLLGCIHGLNERDQMAFQMLYQVDEPLTVDDIANGLGCDRSTAYRSISRLLEAEVIAQRQVNYDDGGYYHVYRPRTPTEVAHDMQRLLNDWYATIGLLIQEFEDRYGQAAAERENQRFQSCS